MEAGEISLMTICGGGVPEVFERELQSVLANIADPNTEPESARKITITFTLKPHEDRSGAQVAFTCAARLVPVTVAKSQVFLSRHTGRLKAYATDARQELLFKGEEPKPMAAVK